MSIQLSEHFTYKKLFHFCLPTIAMMLCTSLYGIVDGYFVSNYVGRTAFASVNLIMPFLMILGCFGFMIGTGGTAMLFLARTLAPLLSRFFVEYDAELFEMTSHALAIYAFSFVLYGINVFASSFFTALNDGGVSAAIAFLRTLLFQTLAVLILPVLFGLDGIWWAITVAEAFALAVSVAFILAKRKKYHYL